jgi:hypothetical protein
VPWQWRVIYKESKGKNIMLTLSTLNLFLFVGLVIFMAGLTLHAVGRAGSVNKEHFSTTKHWTFFTGVGLALWLSVPFVLAKKGILADFSSMPAPFMKVLVAFSVTIVMLSAVSPLGKRLAKGLSLYSLFAFQAFRLALEVLLMLLHKQGLAPVQMTLEGRNWDMVTGVLALGVLIFYRNRPPSRNVYAVLNLVGLALLVNVVAVGFLSLPTPFQVFRALRLAPYLPCGSCPGRAHCLLLQVGDGKRT